MCLTFYVYKFHLFMKHMNKHIYVGLEISCFYEYTSDAPAAKQTNFSNKR